MKKIDKLTKGMGIGGWLTNYKRFNVIPMDRRLVITVGDMEHFHTYITEEDVAYIASLGLDHIRLGFDQVVLEEAPYVYRAEIMEILHSFVSWCEKYGLGIVFNLHKAIGNYCDIPEAVSLMDSAELQDRFIALWLKLEKEFRADNTIFFELMNEVRDIDPELWNDLAERTIQAIRQVNPTRRIIVGSTRWNSPATLDRLRVYEDENVIYTFHNYEPFEFTHQRGVLMADPLYYNRKMIYPDPSIEKYRDYHKVVFNNENAYADFPCMDKKYLTHVMGGAKAFIEAHPDKVLWCGEFGTIRHADIRSRESWMRDMIAILKDWDIPYCVWNYLSTPNDGNRFSLVDDDDRRILSEEMARIIRGE